MKSRGRASYQLVTPLRTHAAALCCRIEVTKRKELKNWIIMWNTHAICLIFGTDLSKLVASVSAVHGHSGATLQYLMIWANFCSYIEGHWKSIHVTLSVTYTLTRGKCVTRESYIFSGVTTVGDQQEARMITMERTLTTTRLIRFTFKLRANVGRHNTCMQKRKS